MWNWIGKLAELQKERVICILATVVRVNGSTPREVGARMVVFSDRSIAGTLGGGHLEYFIIDEAIKILEHKQVKSVLIPLCYRTGQCCGGSVEVMMETLNQGPELYLFGAGHVGKAVAQVLDGTPFTVHLIDPREEWVLAKDLPPSVVAHAQSWNTFIAHADWHSDRTYVGIMTHEHQMDEDIVAATIDKPTKYIGLIGSQTKWQRFKQRLEQRGIESQKFSRITSPIGLSVGQGKAPKEIAISFAAQLLQLHYAGVKNDND